MLFFVGLFLFLAVHLTSATGLRSRLLERFSKQVYLIGYITLSLLGFGLMYFGYSEARATFSDTVLWQLPSGVRVVTLLLVLMAFISLASYFLRAGIASRLKHPQLLAIKLWALGHLLMNGDMLSVILFGSFLFWAIFVRISIKRRNIETPAPTGFSRKDIFAVLVGVIFYGVFAMWLHPSWIGVPVA